MKLEGILANLEKQLKEEIDSKSKLQGQVKVRCCIGFVRKN
jgi:hypothetical protein